jgi:DNA-binding transcriptional LysR family regulator
VELRFLLYINRDLAMGKGIDWENRIGRRVRLRDLHVLFAVAQAGSMVKAAARLGVSQPVVSQAIADLEAAIGVRLLDRSSRGVAPTPYGHTLLKSGQMAFDDLRQGIKEIESLADPAVGEVRIGCPESLSGGLLPPVIERLSRQYPRMVFHVAQVNTLSTQLEFPELRERNLDVILARLVKPFGEFEFEEDLDVEHLFDDELLVVAGLTSEWARRRKVGLAELASAPWIVPPNSWNSLLLEEAFAAIGVEMPRIGVETFSVALRNQLLATGRYVSAIPGSMLLLNTRSYPLKVLPIDLPKRQWPVAMVTLKNRTVTPAVQSFAQCARSVVGSMPPRSSSRKSGSKE